MGSFWKAASTSFLQVFIVSLAICFMVFNGFILFYFGYLKPRVIKKVTPKNSTKLKQSPQQLMTPTTTTNTTTTTTTPSTIQDDIPLQSNATTTTLSNTISHPLPDVPPQM